MTTPTDNQILAISETKLRYKRRLNKLRDSDDYLYQLPIAVRRDLARVGTSDEEMLAAARALRRIKP